MYSRQQRKARGETQGNLNAVTIDTRARVGATQPLWGMELVLV
jgi:hypothetical protein